MIAARMVGCGSLLHSEKVILATVRRQGELGAYITMVGLMRCDRGLCVPTLGR